PVSSTTVLCHAIHSFPVLSTHPSPTKIYTLSLHDALPISDRLAGPALQYRRRNSDQTRRPVRTASLTDWSSTTPSKQDLVHCCGDRKSTRLNSSHGSISYAVFCLKKKRNTTWTDLQYRQAT